MKNLLLLLLFLTLSFSAQAQNQVSLVSRAPLANGGINYIPVTACNLYVFYDASTNGDTQVVAPVSGLSIYICGYAIHTGGTATTVKLDYGTGSNCGTGNKALTPGWQLAINADRTADSPFFNGLSVPAGNALCVNASAGNAVQVEIFYTQF